MPSKFPKQIIEELECVSGRESRSKSATWTRSQYDDPETIDEDIYESPDESVLFDISNKVCQLFSHHIIMIIINIMYNSKWRSFPEQSP